MEETFLGHLLKIKRYRETPYIIAVRSPQHSELTIDLAFFVSWFCWGFHSPLLTRENFQRKQMLAYIIWAEVLTNTTTRQNTFLISSSLYSPSNLSLPSFSCETPSLLCLLFFLLSLWRKKGNNQSINSPRRLRHFSPLFQRETVALYLKVSVRMPVLIVELNL